MLLVLPAAALVLVGLLVFVYVFATVPLAEDVGARPSIVLDSRGRQVATLTPSVSRQDVRLEALPDHVARAVLAAEDRRFFEHGGLSASGILRALFTNLRSGGVRAGGSTITQQYIKNAVLTSERTFTRKIKEAVLAIKTERRFTKEQILERYLNTIYWGRGAYGVEAAARTYFGRPAERLTINQAATLAGIIRAPERLDPGAEPEAANRRRRHVLDAMRDEGFIDVAARDRAVAGELPEVRPDRGVAAGTAAYYLDGVIRELSGTLDERILYRGLTIHTALDPRLQRLAQRAVRERTLERDHSGALVAIDPATGGVRALVGGPDFTRQPFNFAIRGGNQVGSAFKPFTLAAFVAAGHDPAARFPAPAELAVSESEATAAGCRQAGPYTPRNHGRRAYGASSARRATVDSINTVYVQMELETGCPAVVEAAGALGIPGEEDGEPVLVPHTSLTLGVADLTPLQMASAYATLAAEGSRTTPHLVTRVEGPDGEVLHAVEPAPEEALDADDARIVTDVLVDVIETGTGTAARIGRPAAGKTGTTSDNRDAWFVGYTPQLATAVWMGTPDDSPPEVPLTGGGLTAETWAAFMEPAMAPLAVEGFTPPPRRHTPAPEEPTGAGDTPSPTPAPSPSPEPTTPEPSPTPEPTPTPEPSPTPTPTPTATTPPATEEPGTGDGELPVPGSGD